MSLTVDRQSLRLAQRAVRARPHFAALLIGLAAAAPAHAQADFTQTRTSSFSYRADGLLIGETVEPNQPQLCVVTTHDYDDWGNKKSLVTSNCAGASGLALFDTRASSTTYAATSAVLGSVTVAIPGGTFATSSKVALTANINDTASHTEAREYDPRFGSVTRLIGPNGALLATRWEFDEFGRQVKEVRADGTQTVVLHCLIPGRVSSTSSNSDGCTTPTETPSAAVRYEHSVLQTHAGNPIGPWSRVYYDAAGRKVRVATEAFDGPVQPPGLGGVVVQDSHYNAHGAVVLATAPYFLATGSSTTTGNADVGLSKTVYDALGRPLAVYTTDPVTAQQTGGSHSSIDFGSWGSLRAARTLVAYDGLRTITTDVPGKSNRSQWRRGRHGCRASGR